MKYTIERIGRTVELNDELVKEYAKHSKLKDSSFMIVLRSMFGYTITKTNPSDEELSLICNECLLNELKALDMLPKALAYIEKNYDKWTNGKPQEVYLGEE